MDIVTSIIISSIINNIALHLSCEINDSIKERIKTYSEKNLSDDKKELLKNFNHDEKNIREVINVCHENLSKIFKDGQSISDISDIPKIMSICKNIFESIKSLNLNLSKQYIFLICEITCQLLIIVLTKDIKETREIDLFLDILSSSIKLIDFDFKKGAKSKFWFLCC